MQHVYGLDIPRSLEDVCDPRRLALIVYDMQIGILRQIANGAEITARSPRCWLRRARQVCASCSCATYRCQRS